MVYDLRVEVVEIRGFCDQPMHVGDYFEVRGGRVYIPDGKYFCMWAMQSVMPMLPAKQRESNEPNDWIKHTSRMVCPDPNGLVILEITPINGDAPDDVPAVRQEPSSVAVSDNGKGNGGASPQQPGTYAGRRTPPARMLVSEKDCTGCRRCELACSFEKMGHYNRFDARIRVAKDDVEQRDQPLVCRQCGNAWCVTACTAGALTRHPETHAVVLDLDRCTRCGDCVVACPFSSIHLDGDGYPLFCDLCDGNPACVQSCPTGALYYGLAGGRSTSRVARAVHGDLAHQANAGGGQS